MRLIQGLILLGALGAGCATVHPQVVILPCTDSTSPSVAVGNVTLTPFGAGCVDGYSFARKMWRGCEGEGSLSHTDSRPVARRHSGRADSGRVTAATWASP